MVGGGDDLEVDLEEELEAAKDVKPTKAAKKSKV